MTTAIKAGSRATARKRKLLAVADAALALNQHTPPHEMPTLIAELVAKPDPELLDVMILREQARDCCFAAAAAGVKGWWLPLEPYSAAMRAVLDGVPVQQALRKLARQVTA
mgnify:CR=1 FL=1